MLARRGLLVAVALTAGCDGGAPRWDPIFLDGRAVAVAGDTLLAFTRQGDARITVRDRRTGATYARGENALTSPYHVQAQGGHWYVSDTEEGRSRIVVFSSDWELERELSLDDVAATPHQFAVLPDGRIVVEAPAGGLVTLTDDAPQPFAAAAASTRPAIIVAAGGGVLHAAHGTEIALYNENGNLRARRPWPWNERAYVTDLSVDWRGRIHALVGGDRDGSFRVFTLDRNTFEPIRWSEASAAATFVVGRLGELEPDSVGHWVER
jgi:hypothetical protein